MPLTSLFPLHAHNSKHNALLLPHQTRKMNWSTRKDGGADTKALKQTRNRCRLNNISPMRLAGVWAQQEVAREEKQTRTLFLCRSPQKRKSIIFTTSIFFFDILLEFLLHRFNRDRVFNFFFSKREKTSFKALPVVCCVRIRQIQKFHFTWCIHNKLIQHNVTHYKYMHM